MESHNAFADSLYRKRPDLERKRVPMEGTIELTRRCSLKCRHCYIGDARWVPDREELTRDEIFRLLEEFSRAGTLWLTVTGGEALMRKDFPEIWRRAHELGFLLILFTNATLFRDETLGLLRELPPVRIEVSIYGASAATYDAMTGVPGSFDRFLLGVERIRESGIPWLLKAPLSRQTQGELATMRELARGWRVPLHADTVITPSIGSGESGGMAPCSTRISPEEAVAIEMNDEVGVGDFLSGEGRQEDGRLFQCGAARNSFYVNARGMLQGCHLTEHRGERLREQSFSRAWERLGGLRELQRSPESPCFDCDLQSMCRNCPGLASLEGGDEQGAMEWACRHTHLKAHRLGIPHRCSVSHFVYGKRNDSSVINERAGSKTETSIAEG